MYLLEYMQSWMTWKLDVASSYLLGSARNEDGGLAGTFCEDVRESFGALPGCEICFPAHVCWIQARKIVDERNRS